MTQDTSKLHLEILDPKRRKLLSSLLPLVSGFNLSGGTALALQITHRQSFDFDFFSPEEIPALLLTKISKKIRIGTVIKNNADELTFMTADEIKVSFICYPFKALFEKIVDGSLSVFDLRDIAAQKAYTIGRRGTWRDYFDLYCLISEGYITLKQIMANAEKIFGEIFSPKLFLEQLVYFGDITNYEIMPIGKGSITNPELVKSFFEAEVRKVL